MKFLPTGVAMLVAAAIAACAPLMTAIGATTVPKSAVFYLESVYTAAEGTATVYLAAPTCNGGQTFLKNGCSTDVGAKMIDPYVMSARKAMDDLEAFYAAHKDGIGIGGTYDAAVKAYTDLENALKLFGAIDKVTPAKATEGK